MGDRLIVHLDQAGGNPVLCQCVACAVDVVHVVVRTDPNAVPHPFVGHGDGLDAGLHTHQRQFCLEVVGFRVVLESADDLPFPRMVLHMGGSRETADPRKRDAAFSSLEHLTLHAHHAGVTICVENTTNEMGDPDYLHSFVEETRLTLRFNFDIGHAHLAEGPADARIAKGFEPLRDLIASAHVHDNHGEKDEHLPPYDGTIAWPPALAILKSAPAAADLPLTLELKEKTGPDSPSLSDQLSAAAKSLDRLEEDWNDVAVPAI